VFSEKSLRYVDKENQDMKSKQNDIKYIKKRTSQFLKMGSDIKVKPNSEELQNVREKEIFRNKLAGMKSKKERDIKGIPRNQDGPEVIVDHKNRKYVRAPTTGRLHRIKRSTKGERKLRKQTVDDDF
jgi:hypothetical protein